MHPIFLQQSSHTNANMSTTKNTMPTLPLETVQQIVEWVESMHRHSLFAFSLINKACHRAASFLVYRRISITVRDRESLQRDVDRLNEDFSRTDSARHVQSITIKGALRLKRKKNLAKPNWGYMIRKGILEMLDHEEFVESGTHFVVYDEGVIRESSEEDIAWASFVGLLETTSGLRDLIYDCQSQLPPSLLRALHQQHPLCRLHHLTFRFRTLLWGVPHPYEMELATSPCLYRVKLICTGIDSDGDFDYNMDAVMELATGLAPNLKEVSINKIWSHHAPSRRSERRPLWQGLPGFSSESSGSLTSLSLYNRASKALIQKWATYTDFHKLQHLVIGGVQRRRSGGVGGETMAWIARNNLLPNLKTLSINVLCDDHDHDHEDPHYVEHAIAFFQAINSLEELTINGFMEPQMIEAVLIRHGPTLRTLRLEPAACCTYNQIRGKLPMKFTEDQILQIQALCPALETLAVTVTRDKSSVSEATIYKCFGKMKNLRFLLLTLECANWRLVEDPSYDAQFTGEDHEFVLGNSSNIQIGHVKEALINSAVDERLARSIWEIITKNKTGKRLEQLKLWARTDSIWVTFKDNSLLSGVAESMGRSWLLERSPRNDTEEVRIKELMQDVREEYELRSQTIMPEVERIFHAIWPHKQGSKYWQDDWSSFPFQM